MKILLKIDEWLFKAVQLCLGLAMIALAAIVCVQVLVRYVLHVSIGGVEELPVYLMMVSVWLAAIFVAKNDGHVKIELLDMVVKNKKVLGVVNTILCGLTAVSLGYFTVLCWQYMLKIQEYGDKTAGLGIPIWIFILVMVISCGMMTLYYIVNTIKKGLEWKGGKAE